MWIWHRCQGSESMREKPTVGCAGQCLRFCQKPVLETGFAFRSASASVKSPRGREKLAAGAGSSKMDSRFLACWYWRPWEELPCICRMWSSLLCCFWNWVIKKKKQDIILSLGYSHSGGTLPIWQRTHGFLPPRLAHSHIRELASSSFHCWVLRCLKLPVTSLQVSRGCLTGSALDFKPQLQRNNR